MDSNEPNASRRRIIKSAGLTLAAAAAAPAFAQSGAKGTTPAAAPVPLVNPQERYKKPPFENQSQPWPALASKMNPPPDHGEESYRGSNRLAGRKALITGGDSGIGRAAAIAYAREGADVAINYLPEEEPDAQEVVELIRQAGRNAVAIPGDIRDEEFCNRLVNQAVNQLGGLDILVNNAARQYGHDSILDITTEYFDWTLKTNLYAMFWISKAAIPHMPPGSAIINTASVNAWRPSESLLDYAMTKAGIANFSKGLAKQMIDRGIRVNAVAPGPFWTPLQVCSNASPDKLKSFGSSTPMKRPGQPAELATVYVQLASAESSYVTGELYGATGGTAPL
ncbi:SDR family oxidoreductase [Phytohalomonas tamaricis]|uniref:SDR family oxidoreductase n=1 Tax=Phytohalomonas tamaricis TaxID=2081032 RepID=UPI000D0BAD1F|nr:SDR family oxidoreductase [Phytohalomonas tamaricis]